jgi:cyclin-dependent kinase 12/13
MNNNYNRPTSGIGSLACFDQLEQVGEGTYGFVFKAKDKRTGEVVALKKLIIHKETYGFPLCAVREIKFLKSLQHKNIVKLKDIATSKGCNNDESTIIISYNNNEINNEKKEKKSSKDYTKEEKEEMLSKVLRCCGHLYLVFEYMEHDLGGLVESKYKFNVREIKCVMKQIFEVLDYLSEKRIVHRDIKSSNILISNRHQIKLADFGLARSVVGPDGREGKMDLTNNVITMWYKPPELLLGTQRYSHPVDMWSAGCVFAELELGRPIFPGKTEIEEIKLICDTIGNGIISFNIYIYINAFNNILINIIHNINNNNIYSFI